MYNAAAIQHIDPKFIWDTNFDINSSQGYRLFYSRAIHTGKNVNEFVVSITHAPSIEIAYVSGVTVRINLLLEVLLSNNCFLFIY